MLRRGSRLAWSYPIFDEELEPVLLAVGAAAQYTTVHHACTVPQRSQLKVDASEQASFVFSKYKQTWHYRSVMLIGPYGFRNCVFVLTYTA